MFGWINDCTEQLICSKFDVETWHRIKERANCNVPDGGFVRHEKYEDSSTVALVVAASEELGIPVPTVLEVFGQYFMEFTRNEGYENLLRCQGGTLRTWLANVNALHDHLEASLPNGFVKPVFWCQDDGDHILLHYYSRRGSLLAPVVKGVVTEVARFHFDVEIDMQELGLQDENGAKYSTWRISAKNDQDKWKLNSSICPGTLIETTTTKTYGCPFAAATAAVRNDSGKENIIQNDTTKKTNGRVTEVSLSANDMKTIFPYHIAMDNDFQIVQVGTSLPKLLGTGSNAMVGTNVAQWLKITQPVFGEWDWQYLRKLQDQTFFLQSNGVKLKGNWVSIASGHALLILSPDVKNIRELQEMNLTMSDLPLSSFQRDAVFLGEHITSEVNSANKLDKLSKKLRSERNLSNSLLYSLLPKFVAQELRAGNSVDPKFFDNVTILFSDIVGFTSICSKVRQWMVIDMLNRLFCIMDHLCKYFGLYKIDTIGDAFICCSGLPKARTDHAQAVANFAIAVQHCVANVIDPSSYNNEPIQLRIGIHTGPCVSGVVGMSTPKYTIFGDTVNCASRHESTGAPGRTQISRETHDILCSISPNFYRMTYRGFVQMKGKGELETYWLDGAESDCPEVGSAALDALDGDVHLLLSTRTFSKRQYFASGALRRSDANLDLNAIRELIVDEDEDDDDDDVSLLSGM